MVTSRVEHRRRRAPGGVGGATWGGGGGEVGWGITATRAGRPRRRPCRPRKRGRRRLRAGPAREHGARRGRRAQPPTGHGQAGRPAGRRSAQKRLAGVSEALEGTCAPAAARTKPPDAAGRAGLPLDLRSPGWYAETLVRLTMKYAKSIPADSRSLIATSLPFLTYRMPFGANRRLCGHLGCHTPRATPRGSRPGIGPWVPGREPGRAGRKEIPAAGIRRQGIQGRGPRQPCSRALNPRRASHPLEETGGGGYRGRGHILGQDVGLRAG